MTSTRLASLAKRTAQALQAQGRTSVDLYLDDSIFPAPSSAVGWKASYLTGGEVPARAPGNAADKECEPVTALAAG